MSSRWLVTLAVAVLIGSASVAAQNAVRIVDGDTLVLNGQHIRLHGIDAPESDQTCRRGDAAQEAEARWPCGRAATSHLRALIGTETVTCEARDHDRYGRTVALCRAAGVDLGSAMVSSGFAVAYVRYSRDYVAQEAEARLRGIGMWSGNFQMPWDWRREHRQAQHQ